MNDNIPKEELLRSAELMRISLKAIVMVAQQELENHEEYIKELEDKQ